MKKVSFVCTTYKRFTCVQRILSQYRAQTYPNKELIIFNTDVENPIFMELEDMETDPSILMVNNNTDYETGEPYKNRGQICRDAVTHAQGDYFMLADDDDVYLPWHFQQAVDGIEGCGRDAWKPIRSFFKSKEKLELVQNTLEASVIVKMNRIREIGFRMDLTGYEGLSWYTKLRDEGNLNEREINSVPSYCFNWSDPLEISGHKQSGDINNPENFENHKRFSYDYAKGPLKPYSKIEEFYAPFYEYFRSHKEEFNPEYLEKYVDPFLV